MITISATTDLEAVNAILASVQESQVTSLTGAQNDTILQDAIDALNTTSRSVQARGWEFNRIDGATLLRDTSGHIHILDGISQVTLSGTRVSIRNGRLYNMTDRTYVWTSNPTVSFIERLHFDDLPETARRYITVSAISTLQNRTMPDDLSLRVNSNDVREAYVALRAEDTTNSNSSFSR
jgi:hypothetical protein